MGFNNCGQYSHIRCSEGQLNVTIASWKCQYRIRLQHSKSLNVKVSQVWGIPSWTCQYHKRFVTFPTWSSNFHVMVSQSLSGNWNTSPPTHFQIQRRHRLEMSLGEGRQKQTTKSNTSWIRHTNTRNLPQLIMDTRIATISHMCCQLGTTHAHLSIYPHDSPPPWHGTFGLWQQLAHITIW